MIAVWNFLSELCNNYLLYQVVTYIFMYLSVLILNYLIIDYNFILYCTCHFNEQTGITLKLCII